jgi:hypothetical protein
MSGADKDRMARVKERKGVDDNFCPWGILHREDDGRSWATNNTSNLPGVE